MDRAIQREKVAQAIHILRAQDVDCWLTFVRETSEQPDPVLKLTFGHDVTWQSAFILTKGGQRIAIVGRYDAEIVHEAGLYPTVRTYDAGIAPVLLETIQQGRARSPVWFSLFNTQRFPPHRTYAAWLTCPVEAPL